MFLKNLDDRGAWDGWYGPSGRNGFTYNFNRVIRSSASQSLKSIGISLPSKNQMKDLRKGIQCSTDDKEEASKKTPCQPLMQVCLFNVKDDPCEQNNLVFHYPDVIRTMERTLEMYQATAIPPGNKPIDPRADPKFFDYTWTNWWDYVQK